MLQELPVISVIIPVYNSPEGIKATLSCIKAQNYPPYKLETIVVDNGSSDNTIEVIKEFEGINLYEEKEIQGSYAARNKGIKAAKGSIFAFTDADCEPAPDWLHNGVSTMLDQQVELVAGDIQVTYSDTPNLWEHYDALKHLDQENYVKNLSFGATANLFVKAEVFDAVGLFRSDLKSGGDMEFGRRATTQGNKVVFDPNALVYHPARNSFAEIRKKISRVITGQKQLINLGVIKKNKLSWYDFIPVLKLPKNDFRLNLWNKFLLLLILTYFKYYLIYLRYIRKD